MLTCPTHLPIYFCTAPVDFRKSFDGLVGVITTVFMFMSPVFFPATSIPETYRHWLYLNPLTPVIEQTRDVLFWGKAPDFFMLGIYWLVTGFIAWLGFAWFQKTRKGFADVL